ncbi:putative RNA-directed DNA polymerase, eukaryota, reverse transcriptase zinc-binding domain protein [Tanacetum coccineum]
MGDFNVALNLEDYLAGPSCLNSAMNDFKACVNKIEVMDINSTGLHYTWNQKPRSGGGVLKKLDRIMGNLKFVESFPGAYGVFQPYHLSDHSPAFLGTSMECEDFDSQGLFINSISNYTALNMVRNITNEEIKTAMFGIGDDRVPGPDGYTSAFFKKCWAIVGTDVCNAVREFFNNGQLLKEINHTFIALIPKVSTPLKVNDYRPISCCNVLYKCISKILTNRIIDGLKEVVSENQSAFIPGRRISDNILLTQELMHNYHRNRGPPRCAFKVDIQKAYDNVDWNFLENILKYFGFHNMMIKWIMACVTSASFSISTNGDIHGFFNGKRGLRQGDPISPYLFTLVMEVLTLTIKRRVRMSDMFRYHNRGEELQLVNVCFEDDLFIFTRGDVDSARLIMESLDEFQKSSGLVPSIPKSTVYFCNVRNHIKLDIMSFMPFAEGELPVKYLGVPFISSRLLNRDCKVLVEKVSNRIGDWKNKSLSFADIEQLMWGFLWCNGELKQGKAKVAWDIICLPKCEGGLGIHIKADMSWGWRKILQIREYVKPFFWSKLGNGSYDPTIRIAILTTLGMSTSLWFDRWDVQCPLIQYLTPRVITSEGFTLRTCVAELVSSEGWLWPQSWLLKAPNIGLMQIPRLEVTKMDMMQWRDSNGVFSKFSVKGAWEALRPRGIEVSWYHIVWFTQNIPRHAFHLWLVMRNSLKTQDRIRQWDVGPNVDLSLLRCKLCDSQSDSHAHLFFKCSYSARVWLMIRSLAAAASYFIWKERNNRVFKNVRRSPEELRDSIIVTVRLKLLTFRFKNTAMVKELLARWKMPINFRLYG